MTTAVVSTPTAQPLTRRPSYAKYVGAKVLGAFGSLFFVLVVNFFLFRVLPGDPARTLGRGRFKTTEQLEAFRHTYGLDQSLSHQFLTFLQNTFTGQLGISLRYRVPVSDLILDRISQDIPFYRAILKKAVADGTVVFAAFAPVAAAVVLLWPTRWRTSRTKFCALLGRWKPTRSAPRRPSRSWRRQGSCWNSSAGGKGMCRKNPMRRSGRIARSIAGTSCSW